MYMSAFCLIVCTFYCEWHTHFIVNGIHKSTYEKQLAESIMHASMTEQQCKYLVEKKHKENIKSSPQSFTALWQTVWSPVFE